MASIAAWRNWLGASGVPVLAGLAAVVLVALLQFIGFAPLDRIGMLLFDSYQRAAPRSYEPTPVRVVDIDEETIRRMGQWPWPRSDIALLTDRLSEAGAATVRPVVSRRWVSGSKNTATGLCAEVFPCWCGAMR